MMDMSIPHLKPLGMGQLLDRGIRLYRQNFLVFIGIAALVQIPVALISILLALFGGQPDSFVDPTTGLPTAGFGIAGLVAGVSAIVGALMAQIGTAVITQVVADNYLGKTVGILEAYGKIGRSWLSLIGAWLLFLLLAIGLFLFFFIPCLGWTMAIPGVGFIWYFALVVIPLVAPVIVLERQGATPAISRAWELARRRFWWVFGFMLILSIFSQIIVTGPTLLTQFLLTSAAGNSVDPVLSATIQQLISFALSVIYMPLQLICVTLLYFDIRVRTEGFDLALLAADVDEGEDMAEVMAKPHLTQSKFTPSSTEVGYFSLITIGFGILWAGLVVVIIGVTAAIGASLGNGL